MSEDKFLSSIEKFEKWPEGILPKKILVLLPEDSDKWSSVFTRERIRIINVLRRQNPLSQTDLARILNRNRENVIYDLKILKHFDIIKQEREGSRVNVKINRDALIIPVI